MASFLATLAPIAKAFGVAFATGAGSGLARRAFERPEQQPFYQPQFARRIDQPSLRPIPFTLLPVERQTRSLDTEQEHEDEKEKKPSAGSRIVQAFMNELIANFARRVVQGAERQVQQFTPPSFR